MTIQDQDINWLRNHVPGRQKINDLRRIGLFLPDGSDDQILIANIADFLDKAGSVLKDIPVDPPAKRWNK